MYVNEKFGFWTLSRVIKKYLALLQNVLQYLRNRFRTSFLNYFFKILNDYRQRKGVLRTNSFREVEKNLITNSLRKFRGHPSVELRA